MNAASHNDNGVANGNAAGNPFAALLGAAGGAAPGAQAGNPGTAPASAAPTSPAPNTSPLPNPWAPNAGSAPGSAAPAQPTGGMGNLAGMEGLGGLPGLGALGGAGGQPSPEAMLQALHNPAMQQAMQEYLSMPGVAEASMRMAETNPQLRSLMDSNPAIRWAAIPAAYLLAGRVQEEAQNEAASHESLSPRMPCLLSGCEAVQ